MRRLRRIRDHFGDFFGVTYCKENADHTQVIKEPSLGDTTLVGTRRCVGCGLTRDVFEHEAEALGIKKTATYSKKVNEVTIAEGWYAEEDPFRGNWTIYCPTCLENPSNRTFPARGRW